MSNKYRKFRPRVDVLEASANARPDAVIRIALSDGDTSRRYTVEEAEDLRELLDRAIAQARRGDVPRVPPRTPPAASAALPAAA